MWLMVVVLFGVVSAENCVTQPSCVSCSYTTNANVFDGDTETYECLGGGGNLSAMTRPCMAGDLFCKVEMVSTVWSFIGLIRDCTPTCTEDIRYKGYGQTVETRVRCCPLNATSSNCNDWNASSIYTNTDWMKKPSIYKPKGWKIF